MDQIRPNKLRVFLCHAVDDKPAIRRLHSWLTTEGYEAWLDESSLIGGDVWSSTIRDALKSTDIVLACLSERSVTKIGFVQKEIVIALDFAEYRPEGLNYVIPLLLEKCKVPDRLSKWHAIDLTETHGWQNLLYALDREARRREALVIPHIARTWSSSNFSADESVVQVEIEGSYQLYGSSLRTKSLIRRLLDDRHEIVRDDCICVGIFFGTSFLGSYRMTDSQQWGIVRGSLPKRGQLVLHFLNSNDAESLQDEIWICEEPGNLMKDGVNTGAQYIHHSYLIGSREQDPLTIIGLGRGIFLPQTSYWRGAGIFDGKYYLGVYRYTPGVENWGWELPSKAKWLDVWGRHEGKLQEGDILDVHGKDLSGIDNGFRVDWVPQGLPMLSEPNQGSPRRT